jgi:anti-sigma factor RsiW
MNEPCGRSFDESLISGHLDGELTQEESQRVRLHLEDCAACRRLLEEMRSIREATMTTAFIEPEDDQWDETPRGPVSRWSRNLGWTVLAVWLVGTLGFAGWMLATGPEGWVEKLLVFSLACGFLGLFLSILLDRIRTLKTDRYRRVKR